MSARYDNLRLKAKGPMRTKLDGLRKRLDALGAPAATELRRHRRRNRAAEAESAANRSRLRRRRRRQPRRQPKAAARPRAKASNATRAPKKRPAVVAGASVKGTVVSTTSYGAFVRLDGAKENSKPALLHVSEISDELVQDVAKTLPIGSRVERHRAVGGRLQGA